MHNSTLLKLFLFLLSCLTASAQTTQQQQKPNSTKAQLTLNLTTILTHYSIISSSLPPPPSSPPSPGFPHPSNSTKNHIHHLCLSATLSSCPANSLCINHRCRCRLGYRFNLDGHCVLHHCLVENSHDCDRYFPNTVCVEPAHRCVCESDYFLDQPTQKCVFNGPAAEQRKFWSMVITGAMMSTVLVFCCLVCKAKAVGGDNNANANDRVDNGGNGQVRRRGVIRGGERGSHVPPPPPPPPSSSFSSLLVFPPFLPPLHDSPPDYFGIKNFPSLPQPPPPPPPPYTP